VFNSGPKPDTFKDQSEVVATGRVLTVAEGKPLADALGMTIEADATHIVEAHSLQAKCPSKYEGASINKNLDPNFE
jgi:cytochrome c-type biogenesis protein CcmE